MTAVLSFVVLASALATSPASVPLPPFLTAPAAQSSTAAAPAKQPGLPNRRPPTKSTCTADCGNLNAPVSCTGSVCNAVNQSVTCPSGPGSVTCDGVTTYCTPCCTSGTFRNVNAGPNCSCEDGQSTPKDRYQCISGLWEYQSSFCGGPFCIGPQ
jgi:hypothetical protein